MCVGRSIDPFAPLTGHGGGGIPQIKEEKKTPHTQRTLKSGHTSTTGLANHLCASSFPKNAIPSATARSTVGTLASPPAAPGPFFGGGAGAARFAPPPQPPPPPPPAAFRCPPPLPLPLPLLPLAAPDAEPPPAEEEEGCVPSQVMTMCRRWIWTWQRPLGSTVPSRTHSSSARARCVSLRGWVDVGYLGN